MKKKGFKMLWGQDYDLGQLKSEWANLDEYRSDVEILTFIMNGVFGEVYSTQPKSKSSQYDRCLSTAVLTMFKVMNSFSRAILPFPPPKNMIHSIMMMDHALLKQLADLAEDIAVEQAREEQVSVEWISRLVKLFHCEASSAEQRLTQDIIRAVIKAETQVN